jgi:hypothetical protein
MGGKHIYTNQIHPRDSVSQSLKKPASLNLELLLVKKPHGWSLFKGFKSCKNKHSKGLKKPK